MLVGGPHRERCPCLMSAIVVFCELCRLINSRVGVGGGPDWGRCLLSDVLRLLCFASYVSPYMLVGVLKGDGASCLMSAVVVFREMSVIICSVGCSPGMVPLSDVCGCCVSLVMSVDICLVGSSCGKIPSA